MKIQGYSDFADAALGGGSARQSSILPAISSPAQQISKVFTFQSYFDQTLQEKAILTQNRNDSIVASTVANIQAVGYSIGLAPWSQTPVALQFTTGGTSGSSTTYILKPGAVIRPVGAEANKAGGFSGFTWGLPFGWLGGGLATLFVFQTPDARVDWKDSSEVIFHRTTVKVWLPTDLNANISAAVNNWPMRFPWSNALRGAASIKQSGQPIIAVANPTRVLLALRTLTTLGAAAKMRIIYQATNDFGLDSTNAVINTNPLFEDITWPSWTSAGGAGNLGTQNPYLSLTGGIVRLACDIGGGVVFVDQSAGNALSGTFVDVVRYGTL